MVVFSLLFRSRSADTAGVITQRSIFCSKAASASGSESESGLDVRSAESGPPLGWSVLHRSLSDEVLPEEWLSAGPLLDELSELSELNALAVSSVAGGGGRV